ncbi:MAG: alcohol dehydrogenase catalytic domain-containing protein [Chloroflexi bacterium]|nr:alcohol dehydrogenase catalytic domain-containing protein [Chloroflexota bacterium]
MPETMTGAILPGNSTVELKAFPVPRPGPGQVLVKMKASTICGSDIRAIYRQHLGTGPEGYQGVICGHEPCGQIVQVGPGCKRFGVGDRVILYHIAGCGVCNDCRQGYMISCTSPLRAAYGWQRDGGMADYLLAEESTCVALSEPLTYLDGANIACGFGTVWEALTRIGVSGRDHLLVVGLGPVGMAALLLGKALGALKVIGVEASPARLEICRQKGLGDLIIPAGPDALEQIMVATGGEGCERAIDCSGNAAGRLLAIQGTRRWGRMVFVGEGSTVSFAPSEDIMHKQITLYGSWVTSLGHMEDLVAFLAERELHPEQIVTHRFGLAEISAAFDLMDKGQCGKVAILFDDPAAA